MHEEEQVSNPDENEEIENTPKKEKWTLERFLKGISKALKSESITSQQAQKIRSEFGISKSFFTHTRTLKATRIRKRKLQKAARAVTRRHGHKGQKMPKGRSYGR